MTADIALMVGCALLAAGITSSNERTSHGLLIVGLMVLGFYVAAPLAVEFDARLDALEARECGP